MLYLIATPIGNLGDITLRALETLRSCDYLLCEDTRRSRILLKHYEIDKPLRSFHLHNESAREKSILRELEEGKTIGLLSDAGTPGISDPGAKLVQACREHEIEVVAVPGACAAICGLSASGLNTNRFQFFGFLPRKKGKLKEIFGEVIHFPGTTICYESPYRLAPTLKVLAEVDPDRLCVIGRELTKKFEEYKRGTASELALFYSNSPPKGEIVFMISGS